MRKGRFLWLGGLFILAGLAVGFSLKKGAGSSKNGTCPQQADQSNDPISLARFFHFSGAPSEQFPPPKLALTPQYFPEPAESPLGAHSSEKGMVMTAHPASTQSRTISPSDIPRIKQLAGRIAQIQKSPGIAQPEQ